MKEEVGRDRPKDTESLGASAALWPSQCDPESSHLVWRGTSGEQLEMERKI